MKPRVRVAVLVLTSVLVGACMSPVGPSPSVVPTPTPQVPTPAPTASPSPPPAPTSTPAALSEDEQQVADALRVDARVRCTPIRAGLPDGAQAGVECHPDDALVARVEAFGFGLGGDEAMFQEYVDRLAGQEVELRSGDCAAGESGDSSWPAYLPDEGDFGGGFRELRSGCYLDESGTANVALTCYGGILVAITGTGDDRAALYEYAWRLAEGESPDRDPPGMCAAPD